MSELLQYKDTEASCWAKVRLACGTQISISISDKLAGIKAHRGLLARKLFAEKDLFAIASLADRLNQNHANVALPAGMNSPALKGLTRAALRAADIDDLVRLVSGSQSGISAVA